MSGRAKTRPGPPNDLGTWMCTRASFNVAVASADGKHECAGGIQLIMHEDRKIV